MHKGAVLNELHPTIWHQIKRHQRGLCCRSCHKFTRSYVQVVCICLYCRVLCTMVHYVCTMLSEFSKTTFLACTSTQISAFQSFQIAAGVLVASNLKPYRIHIVTRMKLKFDDSVLMMHSGLAITCLTAVCEIAALNPTMNSYHNSHCNIRRHIAYSQTLAAQPRLTWPPILRGTVK